MDQHGEIVDLGGLQKRLMAEGFYGEIVAKFQNGTIVLLEKRETFKPLDYYKLVEMRISYGS